MLEIKHIGSRTHPVTGVQYNAFEATETPSNWSNQWPDGPVLPVGHIVFTRHGKAYEIVASRSVEMVQSHRPHYRHSYLCSEADPRSL